MRLLGRGCSRSGQQKPNCQVYEQCRAQGVSLVSLFSHEIQLAIGIAITWPSRVAENVGTRIITKGHLRLAHAGYTGYCRFLGGTYDTFRDTVLSVRYAATGGCLILQRSVLQKQTSQPSEVGDHQAPRPSVFFGPILGSKFTHSMPIIRLLKTSREIAHTSYQSSGPSDLLPDSDGCCPRWPPPGCPVPGPCDPYLGPISPS